VTPEDPVFNRIYQIKQLEERDCYFQARKCDKYEKHICNFFAKLLKAYQKLISEKELNPLIFIIEDCHLIDDLSIQMIKILKEKSIKGISIICSYQDPISPLIKSQNSFLKHDNLFDPENEYLMDNLTDYEDVADLLMNNLEKNFNIEKINHKLTNILLTKSFKGNPLFLIDIFENLLNSNSLIEIRGKEATLSQELREIVENNDWIDFRIPLRIEKIIGSILDNLDVKEIILLKHAAVIGNFFDIDKLNRMNPFDNILFDDLYAIIQNLEVNTKLK
jgi:predicted ATPase